MKLEDKVAIVTGAGSGIGAAMVKLFAQEGAKVCMVDLQEDPLAKLASELVSEGFPCRAVVADCSQQNGVDSYIKAAIDSFGRVDILCNNAGILDGLTPVVDCSNELWEQVMGVNLTGPMMSCRGLIPLMIEQGGGVILNTASVAGDGRGRGGVAYTASKHAMVGLTRSIAWYYGSQNIRCNALAPGAVLTPMAMAKIPHAGGMEKMAPYLPIIGRYGDPMEVAKAGLFLVSDDSTYVNGSILGVDGGWTIF